MTVSVSHVSESGEGICEQETKSRVKDIRFQFFLSARTHAHTAIWAYIRIRRTTTLFLIK